MGSECDLPGRSMRDTSTAALLFACAALLIALGTAGMAMRAGVAGHYGKLGRIGLAAGLSGAVLLAASILVQALAFGGDFPYMPFLVLPAGLALVIGFLLLGIHTLRSGVLPRWVGALLIVGTLTLVGFNDQNARALLAIPFGIAWVAVGRELGSGEGGR